VVGDIAGTRLKIDGNGGNMIDLARSEGTAPDEYIHFLNYYNRQPDATAATVNFGYSSDISHYNWFSKWAGANERLLTIDASTGNVGIGVSTPAEKLEVNGTVLMDGFRLPTGAADAYVLTSDATGWATWQPGGAGSCLWSVNGDDIYNNNAGNVGIGTDVPLAKQHIRDSSIWLSAEAFQEEVFVVEDQDAVLGLYSDGSGVVGSAISLGEIDGGALLDKWSIFRGTSGNDSQLRFTYGTSSNPHSNATILELESDGNVGIGTSSPAARLEVESDSTATTPHLLLTETEEDYARLMFANTVHSRTWTIAGKAGQSGEFPLDLLNISHSMGGDVLTLMNYGQTGGLVGINTASPTAHLHVNGTTKTDVLHITGADLAEKFPVSGESEPGMVVEIDPRHPGQLRLARGMYNSRVAGVVSGANDLPAGAILGNLPGHENAPPIALSGRVWTLCDASNGAIQPGDLLTTSDTAGHAMKVTDHARAQGAIVGKAMTSLETGKGMVLVLVSLQ
jgi:hypothetical protein